MANRKSRSQDVVAENINRLISGHTELGSTKRLARATHLGVGTIDRIRKAQVACGVDTLEIIASKFGLSAWQLLVPEFDPKHPPVLLGYSPREVELFERVRVLIKDLTR